MNTLISENILQLAGLPLVILFNALLVASEISLIKVRFSHFNPELKERLEQQPSLARLLEAGDSTIRVIRLGLSACLLLYGLLLFPLAVRGLEFLELSFYGLVTPVSLVLAFLLALMLHHLLGELIPRCFGLAYPLQSLRVGAPIIKIWGWITRPLRQLLAGIVRIFWRIFRNEPVPDLDSLDMEAQIELLGKEAPHMSAVAQLILRNAMQMRELVVADILHPRNQVEFFDLNQPLRENLKMAKETGHTRFPLCFGDLDRCIGLIHIKDLFRYPGDLEKADLRRLKRNVLRIDANEPLEGALTQLLAHKVHMALVTDEFRGTEGILTLERILEQLVGDIRDEFDAEEEILIRTEEGEEQVLVSGLTPIHEIESMFNIEIETEEVSTIGGLVTSEFGRIPEVGEMLRTYGLQIEVTQVDETRLVEARIRKTDPAEQEEENSEVLD